MVELYLNLVGSRQSYLSYIFILQSTVKGILGVKVDTGRLAGVQGPIVGRMSKSLSSHSQSRKRFFMLNIRRLPITKCPSESFVQRNVCVEVNKSAYCLCEYCINAEFNLRALKKTSLQNLCVLRTTTKCAVIGLILCSCVRYRCIAQLENVKIVELPSFKKHLYLL